MISSIQNFISFSQAETANLSNSLPDEGVFLELVRRIAVFISVIIPLVALLANCFAPTPSAAGDEEESATPPMNLEDSLSEISSESASKSAILYMTTTGNPTHLGHMVPISAAIDELKKRNIKVVRALVSLSAQSYLESKINRAKSTKIALTQKEREFFLKETIKEAAKRGMFKGVSVEYWDDQIMDNGKRYPGACGSDHPVSYKRLENKSTRDKEIAHGRIQPLPDRDYEVYLVAGIDLCQRMDNWKGSQVKNAVVVGRATEDDTDAVSKPSLVAGKNHERIIISAPDADLAKLSSSAIQAGMMKLSPPSLQAKFEEIRSRARVLETEAV